MESWLLSKLLPEGQTERLVKWMKSACCVWCSVTLHHNADEHCPRVIDLSSSPSCAGGCFGCFWLYFDMSWLFVWEESSYSFSMSVSRGQIFFCIIIYINYNRERLGKMCSIRAYLASSRAWMQAEHRSGEGLCCLRMKGRRAERRGGLLTCSAVAPYLLRGGTMGAISLRGGTVGRTVCLSGKDSCHLRHINK